MSRVPSGLRIAALLCAATLAVAPPCARPQDLSTVLSNRENLTVDKLGRITALVLPIGFGKDSSLLAASKIQTLRSVTIITFRDDTNLTGVGVTHLTQLANLENLTISCPGRLMPGAMESIGKLSNLRSLALVAADTDPESYTALTNLHKLTSLRIDLAPGFNDACVPLLTNLANLSDLRMTHTAVTAAGTNVLRSSKTLTNIILSGP